MALLLWVAPDFRILRPLAQIATTPGRSGVHVAVYGFASAVYPLHRTGYVRDALLCLAFGDGLAPLWRGQGTGMQRKITGSIVCFIAALGGMAMFDMRFNFPSR